MHMGDLSKRLANLGSEHRELEAAITTLLSSHDHDELQLRRLKKTKLLLRDEIEMVKDLLQPDIIA